MHASVDVSRASNCDVQQLTHASISMCRVLILSALLGMPIGAVATTPSASPLACANSVRASSATISQRYQQACIVTAVGTIQCWGYNNVAATVPTLPLEIGVASGYSHTCGLSGTGGVSCWGDNVYGQLNVPSAAQSNQMTVVAGQNHGCALSTTGTVVCWGKF